MSEEVKYNGFYGVVEGREKSIPVLYLKR